MGYGFGIVLLVVGAILSFAITVDVDGIDLVTIGYILMGAGALALILGLVTSMQQSQPPRREVTDRRQDGYDQGYDDRGY